MINWSAIDPRATLGRIVRLPARLLPKFALMNIRRGPTRSMKWTRETPAEATDRGSSQNQLQALNGSRRATSLAWWWLCIPAAIYCADYGLRRIIQWRKFPGLFWDADVIWRAASAVNPYERPTGDFKDWPYLYPPWIVKLLPHLTGNHAVYIVAVALLVSASWLSIYRVESKHFPVEYPRWALLLIYNGPIVAGGLGAAITGNYGFMLTGLYVWAVDQLLRGNRMAFYAVAALCAAVKPQYLMYLVAPWIIDGEVIGAMAVIALCGIAYALNWLVWPDLFALYCRALSVQLSLPVADSGSAELGREILSGRAGQTLGAFFWLSCSIVVVVFTKKRVAEHRDETGFVFALLIIASVLCLPRFMLYECSAVILPAFFLGVRLLQTDAPRIPLGSIVLVALFLPWQAIVGHPDGFHRVVSEQGAFWMLLSVWSLSVAGHYPDFQTEPVPAVSLNR